MQIKTTAFDDGSLIPRRYTCEGDDLSPALTWTDPPAGAASFTLMVDDPDAPRGTWTHWTLFDLPAATSGLAEGWRAGAGGTSGRNDFGRTGYGGPCPPRGHGPHRYFFRLYALDVAGLHLPEGAARREIEQAMAGHVLAQAQLMGRYERR